ncbi:MAG TPA: hypothetical protein VMY69_07940 [Phycisphaerae bacterium]|nr:hypothetical protein [Phycisphaerae bacterium]
MSPGHKAPAMWAALALVAAVLVASGAGAAVLEHKQTGEILKGTLTDQKINNLTVFKTETGETKFIKPEEWNVIEADPEPVEASPAQPSPAEVSPTPEATAPPPEPKAAEKAPLVKAPFVKAYVLPISGGIEHYALVEALQKGAEEAKKKKATVIILRLDTPGGRVDLGEKIIQLIEEMDDWATVVAWVSGGEKRALSCGAYIAMATQKIFMAPGTTLGAATPYVMTRFGPEISEKLTSAFRARFRSLAEQRGHSTALADAMVDGTTSVIQIFLDGQQKLVTKDEADRLEKENEGTGRFKCGKTVSASGKLITLTDQEALEFGVCVAVVSTPQEILKALGHENAVVEEAAWLTGWVQTESRKRKMVFEKFKADYNAQISRAELASSRTSTLKFVDQAAKTLAVIEQLAADPRFDVPLDQEDIDRMKARLQALHTSLSKP